MVIIPLSFIAIYVTLLMKSFSIFLRKGKSFRRLKFVLCKKQYNLMKNLEIKI